MALLIQGVVLGLSVAAPVGPTNIELIRRGLKGGFGVGVSFAAGVLVALIIYLAAIFAGLSFLTELEWFNLTLSIFGVFVLFYLGYTNIRSSPSLDVDSQGQDGRHFYSGILLTLSNPAVLLFWSGIIGANIASREFSLGDSLLISGGILLGVSAWLMFLSTLLSWGRKYVTPQVFKYISVIAGLVLIGFGLSFGYRVALKLLH
jgi:threonine/homoserine/homoserine lactone efflux protein